MKRLAPIMLAGTGSDVGKSLISTGLCRIFKQDGYNPAPFKAQNMALNSAPTADGREIGRAQAVQAEACGLPPCTDMNPILLKPTADHKSQVVVNGVAIGNRSTLQYYKTENREYLRGAVNGAYHRLAERYNPMVIEGAGSIAEINLQSTDIVNMSMAREADAKVILVADIDRGGVFASAYGSIMLQVENDRKRFKGIIINKFRGDLKLFEEGRKMMEDICNVPVIGVVPYAPYIHIDEEDSVALAGKNKMPEDGKINIAVVNLPHISNFTDFNILGSHPDVNLYYTLNREYIARAQIIIIPGTKATIPDLQEIKRRGIDRTIIDAARCGTTIVGICGGYQMLGKSIADPQHLESETEKIAGLGLLPVNTTLTPGKTTRSVEFRFRDGKERCFGYEIHMGETDTGGADRICTFADGTKEGASCRGNIMGSYIHGILDNKSVAEQLLKPFTCTPLPIENAAEYRQRQYDLLAEHLRKYIDLPLLYKILEDD